MERKERIAKSSCQKLKILYLAQLFREQTDDDNHITCDQIIAALARQDITVERKTVYADIEALRTFGMDIIKSNDKPVSYFLASRDFELPELKLLVDSVQACQFITEKKSRELIKKLEQLCSRYQAQQMNRQVTVAGRIKNGNESIYRGVDTIHNCIAQNRKIRFRYFKYNTSKKKVPRHDGKQYVISPYMLTWDNGNYYLVGYDSAAGIMKHYRVDRMDTIAATQEEREGREVFAGIDRSVYTKRSFSMFGGSETQVTMEFSNDLADVVLDRFGDIPFITADEGHFRVSIPLVISPQFYAWVFGLGDGAKIVAPQHACDGMRSMLEKVSHQYS